LKGSELADDFLTLGADEVFELGLFDLDSSSLLLSQLEGTTSGLMYFLAEVLAGLVDTFLVVFAGTLVPTDPDLDEGLVAFSLAALETCAVAESDLDDTYDSVKGQQKKNVIYSVRNGNNTVQSVKG
jgi:hypothetical protein